MAPSLFTISERAMSLNSATVVLMLLLSFSFWYRKVFSTWIRLLCIDSHWASGFSESVTVFIMFPNWIGFKTSPTRSKILSSERFSCSNESFLSFNCLISCLAAFTLALKSSPISFCGRATPSKSSSAFPAASYLCLADASFTLHSPNMDLAFSIFSEAALTASLAFLRASGEKWTASYSAFSHS